MTHQKTTYVIVETFQDVDAAILEHASPEGVLLCLPKHAIKTMGMGMISGFQKHIETNHSSWSYRLTVDCQDCSGQALSALRHGMKNILFSGPKASLEKLKNIATQVGAEVLSAR